MKLLLLSDIHATSRNSVGRKDSIINAFKNKFSFVLKYAKDNNCIILQAGDFLDRSRDWHILYLMIKLLNKYKVRLFSVWGQHDTLMRSNWTSTPTTMSVLNRFGLIEILNKNPIKVGNIYLYGRSWGGAVPVPKNKGINILVIHAPITAKGLFPGHDFTAIQHFLKRNRGWDLILMGDIHIKSIYNNRNKRDTIVVNTGPMLRLASTQYNLMHHPCFFIYDTKQHSIKEIEIPHQKAKEVLTREHIKIKRREDILSEKALAHFAKLMVAKQRRPLLTLKQLLWKIMKKRKTNKSTKELLLGIMNKEYK